ncbi:MAG: ATP-binding protein, partial [Deltaproteobacteria bacterium]
VLALYLKQGHAKNINEEEHLRAIANILAGIIQKKKAEEELDKMEAQLRQAQKIEAIGQLAGGVAHDFNNLMTVIQGNTDLALMKIGEDEPVYRNLREIGRVTAKAAALTRQLLTFSRRQPVSKEILNINKAVLEMSRMLQRLIGEHISLSTELAPDLWNTEADPGQVEQLMMNLLVNARDAMPNGGKLLIKTENIYVDEVYCRIYGEGRPGKFVQISVEDTGTGMDAETSARIFEPFFTTKGVGKGTGLGLSVVYGIVKGHDGWINVYSEPGNGSNFRIYLPAASGGIEEKGEETKSVEIHGGNERILLVEDEKDVRELALLILERQGYKVFVASTFDEAVSIFKEEGEKLDLLLSDMMLT